MECCGNNVQKGSMSPMMGMMKEMMGNTDESFNPMEMCQNMMNTVTNTAKMAGLATPEVQALFEDWAEQVETEVLQVMRQGAISPKSIAENIKISEDSALYFISKLVRDKKIIITGIDVPE